MEAKRDLLSLASYSGEEILQIIREALRYKELRRLGIRVTGELSGKTVALIFEKPSTRTRASMVTAVYELGGMPVTYSWSELQLGRGEPISDTARVLSRYHDCIAARVYRHSTLEELAKYSSVPVINMLSDRFHPLQALADYMTIFEKLGRLRGIKLCFVGDGTDNVLNSLIIAGAKLGVNITVACPKQYRPLPEVLEIARAEGATIEVTENPAEAVQKADVIYTDVFVSMGQEREREERLSAFLPKYQVNRELLSHVGHDRYIFMHCLPARRGEEVTEDVLLDPRHSVVFDQAENRLYTAKAVLRLLLAKGF